MLGCKGVQQVGIDPKQRLCVSATPLQTPGSFLWKDKRVDNKLQNKNPASIGETRGSFQNTDLCIHTKVSIGQTICIATLAGCSESWVTYTHLVSSLAYSLIRGLEHILGIAWHDPVPPTEIPKETGCKSIEATHHHVLKMPQNQIPQSDCGPKHLAAARLNVCVSVCWGVFVCICQCVLLCVSVCEWGSSWR